MKAPKWLTKALEKNDLISTLESVIHYDKENKLVVFEAWFTYVAIKQGKKVVITRLDPAAIAAATNYHLGVFQ